MKNKKGRKIELFVTAAGAALVGAGFVLGYDHGHSNAIRKVAEKMPGVVLKAGSFGAYSLLDAMKALPDCDDVETLLEKAEVIFLGNEWVQDASIVVKRIKE